MKRLKRSHLTPLLAVIAAVLSVIAISVTVTTENGHVVVRVGPSDTRGVAITIGEKASPQEPVVIADKDQQVDVGQAQAQALPEDATAGPSVHEDMKDETPIGAPAGAAEKVVDANVADVGKPLPVGGAQHYDCRWHPVVNHSSRASGAKVSMFVLHYTVSRPGSLDAIWRLFNTPSFGASAHDLLEPSGRCEQIVSYNEKAWTELTFNSVAESIEIMATGSESRAWWKAQPIIKNGILAYLVSDRLRARGLPPRFVDPVGCTPLAGWTDHAHLECGNTHHDVQPAFPYSLFARQVKIAYHGGNAALPLGSGLPSCTVANVKRRLNSSPPAVVAPWSPPTPLLAANATYGPRAHRYVRRFQRAHGLVDDGIIGPQTGAKLRLDGCDGATR